MSFRFMPPVDTAETYQYLSKFMTKDEYLKKLGEVKLHMPEKQIKEGVFPDIALSSTSGGEISIAKMAEEHNIVLFFYPGDKEGLKYPEIAGCTPEACSFKDAINDLERLNTKVFGVSFQTTDRQNEFVQAQHLNFPLLSDAQQKLSQALGLPHWESKQGEQYPTRQTYIITKGNEIAKVFEKVEPNAHIDDVLTEIKKMENVPELK